MFSKIASYIRELYNSQDFIPLSAPVFIGNEKKYLEECIDSTFVSGVGKFVDRFEKMVADYTGAGKAVVCVNGTNALHMAMMLAGVEREYEVITQALTFVQLVTRLVILELIPFSLMLTATQWDSPLQL